MEEWAGSPSVSASKTMAEEKRGLEGVEEELEGWTGSKGCLLTLQKRVEICTCDDPLPTHNRLGHGESVCAYMAK